MPVVADQTIDCLGLFCPMPIVKTSQAIKGMAVGDTLEILATDRGAVSDVPAWCRFTGNELLEQSDDGGVFRFVVRKAS